MRPARALLAAVLALACRAPAVETEPPPADTPELDPARGAFDQLEQRLTDASRIEMIARITAAGRIRAALEGTLLIDGDHVLLGFEGELDDQAVRLSLSADGAAMAGGNGTLSFEHERPRALDEGLLIGLTRMGILHNLAVLASGNPPQGTFGGVREWVRVLDVHREDDHLTFDIEVDGKRTASAKLWLDTATGLPARREQTVHFPSGTMTVVETYESFSAR